MESGMQQYIGTKIIHAEPESRGPLPEGEPGYRVRYPDGYSSWSPKDVFEAAYRRTDGMNFGLALEALKAGKRVARAGWNGKGMWLSLSGPARGARLVGAEQFWSQNNAEFARARPHGVAEVLPCITMKTADDAILMGWLASQTDMLADDWMIVED